MTDYNSTPINESIIWLGGHTTGLGSHFDLALQQRGATVVGVDTVDLDVSARRASLDEAAATHGRVDYVIDVTGHRDLFAPNLDENQRAEAVAAQAASSVATSTAASAFLNDQGHGVLAVMTIAADHPVREALDYPMSAAMGELRAGAADGVRIVELEVGIDDSGTLMSTGDFDAAHNTLGGLESGDSTVRLTLRPTPWAPQQPSGD